MAYACGPRKLPPCEAATVGTRRIRRAAREGRCEFTVHAIEEMDEDGLTEGEVVSALARGRLESRLASDRRGVRFVVRGPVTADRRVEVVCRFLPSGRMRIITAYLLEG